jgi:hypothetical protein
MDLRTFLSGGLLLQAIALVHFFQRRPEAFWFWAIIFLGPFGAGVYLVVEVVPDLGLLRHTFDAFGRRSRIRYLEGLVQQNPASGNFEELADQYLDDGQYERARACYDRAISARTDHPDPFYRRGLAALQMGEFEAAMRDFEWVTAREPKYDSWRALALLAHACDQLGQHERAEALFQQATEYSTASETYYNYALFLKGRGRMAEAREWAERILAKKPTMPRYLRRLERPWFRKASALLGSGVI